MKVAVLQYGPTIGDVDGNIHRADGMLEQAEKNGKLNGLQLLVLPELAFCGYNFPNLAAIKPYLEPTAAGVTAQWAVLTATRLNCIVSVGYAEKSHETSLIPKTVSPCPIIDSGSHTSNFNSTLTVTPDGKVVAHYRKTHLYYTDASWAARSPSGFLSTKIPLPYSEDQVGIETSFGICMDLNPDRFTAPWTAYELATFTLASKARLLTVSTAWLTRQSREELNTGVAAPDIDTLSYWVERLTPLLDTDDITVVIIANRTGIEEGAMRACSLDDSAHQEEEEAQKGAIEEHAGSEPVISSATSDFGLLCEEARYAGTSVIMGLGGGKIRVWGMLGKAQEGVLVVDTSRPPESVMALRRKEEKD